AGGRREGCGRRRIASEFRQMIVEGRLELALWYTSKDLDGQSPCIEGTTTRRIFSEINRNFNNIGVFSFTPYGAPTQSNFWPASQSATAEFSCAPRCLHWPARGKAVLALAP